MFYFDFLEITRFLVPSGQPQFPTLEEKVDADNRSIYVGQVTECSIEHVLNFL